MIILDTDHVSVLERQEGTAYSCLIERLSHVDRAEVFTSIITVEEGFRGWMALIAKAQKIEAQVEAYGRLSGFVRMLKAVPTVAFDAGAAVHFRGLRKTLRRLAAMDLKIAAIALSHDATLLTRNKRDFGQVPGLKHQDWTREQ